MSIPTAWSSSSFYRSFVDALPIPVFVIDQDHRFLYANQGFLSIFGLPSEAVIGKMLWDYWPEDEFAFFKAAYDQVVRTRDRAVAEFESLDDGSFSEVTMTWWEGYVVGAVVEVTSHRRREQAMQLEITTIEKLMHELAHVNAAVMNSANTDSLTGLRNRRQAEDLGQRIFRAIASHDLSVSLLMIDIDHFKHFNDKYGHEEGDKALCLVADVLRGFARDTEVAARIGGEEFLILCPDVTIEEAEIRAQELVATIRAAEGTMSPVTVSIGVAAGLKEETDWHQALRRADQALYVAKARGRDRVVLWTPDMKMPYERRRAA